MRKYLLLFIFLCTGWLHAQAQFGFEKMVELTGVVMSADSLRYLPFVSVGIPSRQSGTTTSEQGVFSLIAEKGDTLEFRCVGFRKKRYIIPKDLPSSRYSVIQLMSQDTFFLSPTFIHPQVTPEEFAHAFKTMSIPDDQLEIARKNTEYQTMRMLLAVLPHDGRENQHTFQTMQAQKNYWAGQQPPMTIFNPLAWKDFFDAWKRGDFKNKH